MYIRLWELFTKYVHGAEYGCRRFRDFVRSELGTLGVVDLTGLGGDEYDRASANNIAYILERRSWMRERLDAAARQGTLAYTNDARLPDFARSKRAPEYTELYDE